MPLFIILSVIIGIAVVKISRQWSLEPEQILTLSIGAAAFPLALLTQRTILIENQRYELARKGYEALQKPVDKIRESLVEISQTDIDEVGYVVVVERVIKFRRSIADFTDTFHYHEMIFNNKLSIEVEYLHYSMMKLAYLIDDVGVGYKSMTNDYSSEGRNAMDQAKALAGDIAGYMYDLNKELIENLGFDRIFNTVIKKRETKDGSKILSQIATKKELKKLKDEVISEH